MGQHLKEQDVYHIIKAKNGDEESMTYLINKFKNLAYSIALKITNNHSLSEDIVQDAFINVFLNIKRIKDIQKFSSWLYAIVYRESLKQENKNIKIYGLEKISGINHVFIENQEQQNDQRILIKKAMEKLNRNEYIIIYLFYLAEKSIKEIQQVTGLSKSSIKVILHRGRVKMEIYFTKILNVNLKDIL